MHFAPDTFESKPTRRRLMIGLFLCSPLAPLMAPAQALLISRDSKDTLPANVVTRSLEAYNRHDAPAYYAFYDTIFIHELLADTTRRVLGSGAEIYSALPEYFTKNIVRVELKQQLVNGPFVVLLYDAIENDKRAPHLDIFEVRQGKIVHEWEQP